MPKETETKVRLTTKGRCVYCSGEYSKAGMTKHLSVCPARQAQAVVSLPANPRQKVETGSLFHLLVEGRDAPIYWMHLEVAGQITLTNLDNFLRDKWLECCGHLSAFEINQVRYAAVPDTEYGMEEKSMRGVKLEKVLAPGQSLHHEYDYGSTTNLNLRVLEVREGKMVVGRSKVKWVQIMAQNEAPLIPCEVCGKNPATQICTECRWHGQGWLCQKCAEAHQPEHGDFYLPVVNSPRVGECGYVG